MPCLKSCLLMFALLASPLVQAGKTLDSMRQRDQISVGVSTGVAGFSATDSQGHWSGLDVDIAKAVAAALLGSPDKVKWVPLASQQRFTALQSGEVDLLSRNTTLTLTRDAAMGLAATAVVFYDGQGFMVPTSARIKNARQLKGASVCVQSGTTSEKNLSDFSRAHQLALKPLVFDKFEAANAAYFAGRCQAYSTDASGLAAVRAREARDPKAHTILPDLISKEPLGPLVRRGDEEWLTLVRWVIYGLIEAEENGVTQANVERLAQESSDPVVGRLLGKTEDTGRLLGVNRDWLLKAIKAVGNYGEIYERHVGEKTPVGLPRGMNRLWNQGGLQYAWPLR